MNGWTLLVTLVILAQWTVTAAIYRWVWGRWLQGWAWPLALGFCLFGRRAERWEQR